MKPQKQRDLLINPGYVQTVHDRGINWITDRYVVVRADLFKKPPTLTDLSLKVKVTRLRSVLTEARDTLHHGPARVTQHTLQPLGPRDDPTVGVAFGSFVVFVNERPWRGLLAAGARPVLTRKGGALSWYALIRGKQTLVAYLMPKYPPGEQVT